jgi:putative salt-induced outer membrane protein YdiY
MTGTLEKISSGVLHFITEYMGTVQMELTYVQGISTEHSLALQQQDQVVSEGVLRYVDGKQLLLDGDKKRPLPLDTILATATDKASLLPEDLEDSIDPEPSTWSGSINSGLLVRSGEKDLFTANLDLLFKRQKARHTLTLKANTAYAESDKVLNTQRFYGEGKWQFFPEHQKFYYFGLLSGEHDDPRQLKLRTVGAGGLGIKLIEKEHRKLSAEMGPEYTVEYWEEKRSGGLRTSRREQFLSGRLSLTYEQKIFNLSTLNEELVLVPSFEKPGEYRATNALSLDTPLSDALSLRVQLKTEYISDPGADNVESFDNILSFGVGWQF